MGRTIQAIIESAPAEMIEIVWRTAKDVLGNTTELTNLQVIFIKQLMDLGLQTKALNAAKDFGAEALCLLSSLMVKQGHEAEALSTALGIHEPACRAQALAAILPNLPDQLSEVARGEVAYAASRLLSGTAFATEFEPAPVTRPMGRELKALLLLLPYLQIADRYEVIDSALGSLLEGDNEETDIEITEEIVTYLEPSQLDLLVHALSKPQCTVYRARALTAVTIRLAQLGRIDEALSTAISIDAYLWRKTAVSEVLMKLSDLAPLEVDARWAKLLRSQAAQGRRRLCAFLDASIPLLRLWGSNAVLVKVFRALDEVGRWWP